MSKALELADEYARKCVLKGGIIYGAERAALQAELRRLAAVEKELERIRALEPVAWMHQRGNFKEANTCPLADDGTARGWTETPLYDLYALTPKDPI